MEDFFLGGGNRELVLSLAFHIDTHSVLSAKMSSIETADCVVDAECLNTSICLTCHFLGQCPTLTSASMWMPCKSLPWFNKHGL